MNLDAQVIGGGGHAKVVIQTLRACGFNVVAVFDDNQHLWQSELCGVHVLGGARDAGRNPDRATVIAIGTNEIRKDLAQTVRSNWIVLRHPSTVVDATARIGAGSMIMAGTIIQADAVLGQHVIANTGSSVDHDCVVGDYVHLCPGVKLAGNVTVGDGVTMGIGSCAIPGVTIGSWTTVGAGAAVVSDLPENCVAVGVPARIIRSK